MSFVKTLNVEHLIMGDVMLDDVVTGRPNIFIDGLNKMAIRLSNPCARKENKKMKKGINAT